jgi:hypothetical protein
MAESQEAVTGKRNEISVVAQDKNWRDYISKEIKSADTWQQEWGFLASGNLEEGVTEAPLKTHDERIAELQAQLAGIHARDNVTSSTKIGRGAPIEMFPTKHYNI